MTPKEYKDYFDKAKINGSWTKEKYIKMFMKDGLLPEERLLRAIFGEKDAESKAVPEKNRARMAESLWRWEVIHDKADKAAKDPETCAKSLMEYNLYRRGQGKYKFSEDPKKRKDLPWPSVVFGRIMEIAISYLKEYQPLYQAEIERQRAEFEKKNGKAAKPATGKKNTRDGARESGQKGKTK